MAWIAKYKLYSCKYFLISSFSSGVNFSLACTVDLLLPANICMAVPDTD